MSRRIPIQSVAGSERRITEALRLLLLLGEVERQAGMYSAALEDALAAAIDRQDADTAWRHLQAAIFAAIVVNRLVSNDGSPPKAWEWLDKDAGRQQAAAAAAWRVRELRRLLSLPDDEQSTPIYTVRGIRNDLEHIAERLDLAIHAPGVASISDWYLSDGTFLSSPGAATHPVMAGLRGFCPEAGLMLFDATPLDVFSLDLDMHRLRNNAREAQVELVASVRGHLTFGNATVVRQTPGRAYADWRRARQQILNDMPPPVQLDGHVRLWLQLEEDGAD